MAFKNEHLTRQLDIIPVSCLGERITVIGAGAIGGWTTLALAKMGFSNLTVIDFDKVEVENMNSQFYRFKDIGKPKVKALQELVEEFTNVRIEATEGRYEKGVFPGIVIAAVDSMAVRANVFGSHRNIAANTKAIIDPRMGAESALLFVVNPMEKRSCDSYSNSLYSDESAVRERCTAKATIYTANLLSGLVSQVTKDIACGGNYAKLVQWGIKDYQFQAWKKENENA